jgi:hypothetical protein
MVPPPSHNTVEVCNHITLLIVYYISSRLVALLKVTDVPTHVSDIFDLTVSFMSINYSFQIFLALFLQCPIARALYCLDYVHCLVWILYPLQFSLPPLI